MAKKKKSQKQYAPKPKPKLETVFDCPFCNHSLCVEIKLDRDRRIGNLKCRICSTGHRSRIHHLSAAVDVYCNWIDDCHRVNQVGPQKSFLKKLGDKTKPIEATEQDGFSDEEGHI